MNLERAMEFLLEQQAAREMRFDAQMATISANLDRTETTLRRATRLSVEEHRRERVRRQQMRVEIERRQTEAEGRQAAADASMAEVKANVAGLAQTVKSFIESLKQPRNGN